MSQHSINTTARETSASTPIDSADVPAQPVTFMRLKTVLSENAFSSVSVDTAEAPAIPTITVNGERIDSQDLLAEAQHHPASDAQSALDDAARALVVKTLLLQEAQRLKLHAVPETDAAGRQETEHDALIRVLLDQEVCPPQANETDCQRYYDNHRDKFLSDTLYEVRHILLAAREGNSQERESQRLQAQALIAHLQEHPSEFNSMAIAHSDCPSRDQGGNLGQLSTGSTVREFEQALKSIPPGTLAKRPIETRYGFHVVFVENAIPGARLPFDAVRERIAAWLEASSWSRAMSQYISILAGQANVEGFSLRATESPLVQ